MPKPSRASLFAVGLLVVTWLIFFSRTLTGRAAYFLDDLKIIYYPLEVVYAQFQAAGELPLWSQYFGFGHPLLAWGQLGFFTPLHVILRALHIAPLLLLQISVMAYFGLGLTGFYLFLRRYLPTLPAALGAIVFTFSGFNIGHLNHVNFYVGTMLVPWLLLAVDSFIAQPSLKRTALVSALGAAIAVSAQPQIVTYSFILVLIIALFLLASKIISFRQHVFARRPYLIKVIGLSIIATLAALCLAAIAILPLAEFLPQTERNAGMSEETLYEFSYPPANTITLIFPYFFGDHVTYWGPKGLQELAAFTGILPLLLAVYALAFWRRNQAIRGAAILLCIIGIAFALGEFSPLYHFLVTHKILTSLAIPGRFVFFFDTGIAILAALGLWDIITRETNRKKHLAVALTSLFSIGLLLFVPILIVSQSTPRIAAQLNTVLTEPNVYLLLIILGVVVWIVATFLRHQLTNRWLSYVFISLTAITVIVYGFNFNPTTPWDTTFSTAPFKADLINYQRQTSVLPRLYSRSSTLTTSAAQNQRATSFISPQFTIYQPISLSAKNNCLVIPFYAEPHHNDTVTISLHTSLSGPPLTQQSMTTNDLINQPKPTICFNTATFKTAPTNQVLSISSTTDTKINAYYTSTPGSASVYLVRVNQPNPDQLRRSIKPGQLVMLPVAQNDVDEDNILLSRHLQATVPASSARWIGALSIRPYREFIEKFFANDNDQPFNGDGQHAIEEWRVLLNMAGVTHLIQSLNPTDNDDLPAAGYQTIAEYKANNEIYRLYQNPDAYPKTWLVPEAIYIPAADDTRYAMMSPDFNPRQTVYISGPTPPDLLTNPAPFDQSFTTSIKQYDNTEVVITVTSDSGGWLILSDATTDQWETYIDDNLAPHYVANTVFKAAQVPPGQHQVKFIYDSPATNRAIHLGQSGLVALVLLLLPYKLLKHAFTRSLK